MKWLFGGGKGNNNNNWNPNDDNEEPCNPATCRNQYHWREIDGHMIHDPQGVAEYAQGIMDGSIMGDPPPNTPAPDDDDDISSIFKKPKPRR